MGKPILRKPYQRVLALERRVSELEKHSVIFRETPSPLRRGPHHCDGRVQAALERVACKIAELRLEAPFDLSLVDIVREVTACCLSDLSVADRVRAFGSIHRYADISGAELDPQWSPAQIAAATAMHAKNFGAGVASNNRDAQDEYNRQRTRYDFNRIRPAAWWRRGNLIAKRVSWMLGGAAIGMIALWVIHHVMA